MINMKREAEREEKPGEIEYDEPAYSYGLCISLDQEDLGKLGLNALPAVGAEMMIMAKAYVKSTSAYETQGQGKDMSVSLQITDLEIKGQTDGQRQQTAADGLYGKTMMS
ncbi:accessory protein [Caudoviricetes sp.]|nr:accessory protein [Caudoviricetes sp.]